MAQATGSLAIEVFDPANTTWRRWLQRLQGAFMIFGIKDQTRIPYLLHYVGPTAFDMISDRLDPVDPFTGRYDDLVKMLQEYYAPAPLEIAENFTFHQQRDDESVQQYVAALRKLSIHCKFGDYLNIALRNQLVFGLRSSKAQSRLLEKTDLDFDEAVRIAASMELSDKSSAQMKDTSTDAANMEYLKAGKKPPRKNAGDRRPKQEATKTDNSNHADKYSKQYKNTNVKCFRCGKGHLANKCNLDRSVRCYSCGKLGHLRAVCFKNTSSTNNLEEMLSLEHSNYRDKFLLSMEVEGKKVEFEIDSGAAVTVMSESEATKLFPTATIRHTDLRLISFCGRALRCKGYVTVCAKYNNSIVKDLNIYLISGVRKPLLGREWIRQFNGQDFLVCNAQVNSSRYS